MSENWDITPTCSLYWMGELMINTFVFKEDQPTFQGIRSAIFIFLWALIDGDLTVKTDGMGGGNIGRSSTTYGCKFTGKCEGTPVVWWLKRWIPVSISFNHLNQPISKSGLKIRPPAKMRPLPALAVKLPMGFKQHHKKVWCDHRVQCTGRSL